MVELTSTFEKKVDTGVYSWEAQSQDKYNVKRNVVYKHTPTSNLKCEYCKKIFKSVLTYNSFLHKCI